MDSGNTGAPAEASHDTVADIGPNRFDFHKLYNSQHEHQSTEYSKTRRDMQSETATTYTKQGGHDIRTKIGKRCSWSWIDTSSMSSRVMELTRNNLRRGNYSLAETDREMQPSSGGRTGHGCSDVDTSCAGTEGVVIEEYNGEYRHVR